MASLTNTKIKDTYDGLLKTTDNNALGGTYKLITDGLGNSSGVYLGTGGNVGIGTNQPQTLVQLSNNNSSTNSEQGAISFSGDTATRYSQISGFRFNNSNQAGLDFKVYNGALNNAMRIKNDGNVGIGDINPGAKLVVAQPQIISGGFSTPFIELKSTAQTNTTGLVAMSFSTSTADNYGYSIGALRGSSGGASSFVISHHDNSLAGTERMRIDSSGNVGIGTTDPQKLLHIASQSAQSVITLQRTNTNTSGAIGALQWTALDNHTVASMVALGDGNNEGAHITFNTTSAASSDNPFGISERMRIDSSGKVGIGYVPESSHGNFNSIITGASTARFHLGFGTNGDNYFTSGSNGIQVFRSDTTERMRIQSGGTVLVGKTSSSSSTTGVELNPVGLVQVTRNGNLPLLVNRTGTDGTVISIRNDNSTVGTISVSGSTTSYNETSDYRLKENVVDLTGALDRIEQLQPKRFNFISEETTVDGFIAHEVQSVIPEAVFGEKDAVDDEGNPDYQGIDKSKIVPLLVGAIKELKAEIETLKSQINS